MRSTLPLLLDFPELGAVASVLDVPESSRTVVSWEMSGGGGLPEAGRGFFHACGEAPDTRCREPRRFFMRMISPGNEVLIIRQRDINSAVTGY